MELVKAGKEDYRIIKRLYLRAFPPDERAPFFMLRRRAGKDGAVFLKAVDQGQFVGFAYLMVSKDLAYLFYLAVDESLRGNGCGTQIIAALREKYAGKTLFLALEAPDETAPNASERVARHRFYERAGLHDMPYHIKEGPVTYAVMGNGAAVEPEEYRELVVRWGGPLLVRLVDMRILKQ